MQKSKVAYATFTGKAAEVLRKKGNENACTLHKLLYEHVPMPGGGFLRKRKRALDCTIVVVDEISMVPKEITDLLFTHNVYVICLGDPFQLPQINKDDDNHLLDNPHIFLTEIMRQAEESEIVRLSMDIRNGKEIKYQNGSEVKVYPKSELVDGMYTWADQVIVSKNATRIGINNQVRSMLGFDGAPKDGDKLVCLRNYWDDCSDYAGDALVNGTTGILRLPKDEIITFPFYARTVKKQVDIIRGNLEIGEDQFSDLMMDKEQIVNGEFSLDWRDSYKLGKLKAKIGDVVPKQFDYGYAITVWKAQGSEWDKVLAIEEDFPFDPETHQRALYTMVTRAKEKLVLLLN